MPFPRVLLLPDIINLHWRRTVIKSGLTLASTARVQMSNTQHVSYLWANLSASLSNCFSKFLFEDVAKTFHSFQDTILRVHCAILVEDRKEGRGRRDKERILLQKHFNDLFEWVLPHFVASLNHVISINQSGLFKKMEYTIYT